MSKKLKHRIIFAIGCILLFVLCVGAVNAVLSLFVKDDKVAETNQKTKQVKKEIKEVKSETKKIKSQSKNKKNSSKLSKRAEAYKKAHKDVSDAEAIEEVKMNLDYEPYTHVTTVSDLDNMQMLVNKYHNLPEDYEPSDLVTVTNSGENNAQMRKEAANAFEALVQAAQDQGIELSACSAYRSYSYQKNLYETGVQNNGQEYADKYWTRPGFSEHQTGLSVDIRLDGDTSDLDAPRNSANYPWLLKHMHKYGFIVRYPDDKEQYTLIAPESWHLRYVGEELATYLYENNLCLEEYYALQ